MDGLAGRTAVSACGTSGSGNQAREKRVLQVAVDASRQSD
jgi:hypothetical protein